MGNLHQTFTNHCVTTVHLQKPTLVQNNRIHFTKLSHCRLVLVVHILCDNPHTQSVVNIEGCSTLNQDCLRYFVLLILNRRI